MYIIIPVIIITIIVGVSFGLSNFRNIDVENQDVSSIGSTVMDFLNINLTLGDEEKNQESNTPPALQAP
ncbi:MAG TPA: hypothetical protein VGA53_03435 [Candidatus Paceibacterota bacterium]